MAEKKVAAKKVATKTTEKKAEVKAAPAKKAAAVKKTSVKELYINAESAGFRAGDVYQALASAKTTLTVAEISKKAGITTEEVLLGLGWLLKEGKVKGVNVADITLA